MKYVFVLDYYDNTLNLMKSINRHTQNTISDLMETKGILLQLLAPFFKQSINKYDGTDNRIRDVLSYIRKNIKRSIKMEDLTEICHLSKDHFIRLFKKEMEVTPVQYINQTKIKRAQLMLITENSSVKNIAYALSFENVYYFNRLFKKITGLTPVEYKKSLR